MAAAGARQDPLGSEESMTFCRCYLFSQPFLQTVYYHPSLVVLSIGSPPAFEAL